MIVSKVNIWACAPRGRESTSFQNTSISMLTWCARTMLKVVVLCLFQLKALLDSGFTFLSCLQQ